MSNKVFSCSVMLNEGNIMDINQTPDTKKYENQKNSGLNTQAQDQTNLQQGGRETINNSTLANDQILGSTNNQYAASQSTNSSPSELQQKNIQTNDQSNQPLSQNNSTER